MVGGLVARGLQDGVRRRPLLRVLGHHCDALLRKVAVTAPAAPCPQTITSHAAPAPHRLVGRARVSHLGSHEHGSWPRGPAQRRSSPSAALPRRTAGPAPGGWSPPPAATRLRPRQPRKPGSAARTPPRRRREPHWACSALAGSGARRWKAPTPGGRARSPHPEAARAEEVGTLWVLQTYPGGHGERRTATTGVAQRCQVSEGTGRVSLGGEVRYGRREPRAGLVVSGHPSCATFGRLGWRRLRLEVPCGPRSRLVAGCWKYMQGGGWWVGGQPSSRLVPQPSEGQERAVYSALTQSLSDLPRGGGRLRRAVDRSRHGASVSPRQRRGCTGLCPEGGVGSPEGAAS